MKKVLLLSFLIFCLSLVSCGDRTKTIVSKDGQDGSGCMTEVVANGLRVICGDEVTFIQNGQDGVNGRDGQDGVNGRDGQDAASLTKVIVKKKSCTKVGDNLYVENIKYGTVFDVYKDSSCDDKVNGNLNEYCDNVQTQYGNSGDLGQGEPGSATICWVGNKQLSGIRLPDDSIEIRILDFN